MSFLVVTMRAPSSLTLSFRFPRVRAACFFRAYGVGVRRLRHAFRGPCRETCASFCAYSTHVLPKTAVRVSRRGHLLRRLRLHRTRADPAVAACGVRAERAW